MQSCARVGFWLIVFALAAFTFACEPQGDDDDDNDNGGYEGPPDNPHPYTGPDDDDTAGEPGHNADEHEALERFQPLLVQRLPQETPLYNPWFDHLGQLALRVGEGEFDYEVSVNWHVRAVYATARPILLNGEPHLQLFYFVFYAERPIAVDADDDPFAWLEQYLFSGPIDAKVLRVTLDADGAEPLFLEAANLSGTEYKLHVNKRIENEARDEFAAQGVPFEGLARPDGPGDEFIDVLPGNVDGATWRPTFALADGYDEGFHRILGGYTSYEQYYFSGARVESGLLYADPDWYIFDAAGLERADYALLRYEDLLLLPPADSSRPIGIYDRWSKIWNAYTPLAMPFHAQDLPFFPGTPGDVDDLRIINGRYAFQDPGLIAELIYLPRTL